MREAGNCLGPSKNLFSFEHRIRVHIRDVGYRYVQVGQFSSGLDVAEFKRPSCPTWKLRARQDARFLWPPETVTRVASQIPGIVVANRPRP